MIGNKIYSIPAENYDFKNYSLTLCEDKDVHYPVFVYGTLKNGFFNHKRCGLDQDRFVGTCYSRDKIFNFWSMQGVYPAVVKSDSEKYRIGGELYLVDEKKIINLDLMENNYHRVSIPITMRLDNCKSDLLNPLEYAFLYILNAKNEKSNYWAQDGEQVKVVDDESQIKIWSGKWAKEELYKRGRLYRNQKKYVFSDDFQF